MELGITLDSSKVQDCSPTYFAYWMRTKIVLTVYGALFSIAG